MSEDISNVDIVIFGAGITGLTVAHELALRHFRVAVVDPAFNYDQDPIFQKPSIDAENPGIGGMARSQWGYLPNDPDALDPPQVPTDPPKMVPVMKPGPFNAIQLIYSATPTPDKSYAVEFKSARDVCIGKKMSPEDAFKTLLNYMEKNPKFFFYCQIVGPGEETNAVTKALNENLKPYVLDKVGSPGRTNVGISQTERTVTLQINSFPLPGEHGFRFFPSFYRHIFDLMKRTPLMEIHATSDESYLPKKRGTVFDNLVPVDKIGYVTNRPGPSVMVPRKPPQSMEEVRQLMNGMLRKVGYTEDDAAWMQLKLMKYITSSRRRREQEYENLSWSEFVENEHLSARAGVLNETAPSTLSALHGSSCDARTQGTIAMQLAMDEFLRSDDTDMLLNGPTDNAWFGHWYRYLRLLDVQFFKGTLSSFESRDGTVAPVVLRDPNQPDSKISIAMGTNDQPTRFVIAVPLYQAWKLSQSFLSSSSAPTRDFQALRDFPKCDLDVELIKPLPRGPLRHLTGVQYFFNQDLRLLRAHTQYMDALWGLTAVAQPQFWRDFPDLVTGYLSILSVDVATWAPPSKPLLGVSPHDVAYGWGRSADDIAKTVLAQIRAAHEGDFPTDGRWPRLPAPFAYHVDDNLVFDRERLVGNLTPFQVNEKGRYRKRPGAIAPPDASSEWKANIEYDVAFGRYVLAGTYMQTYTRVNSMEAACESGRHAVNALLQEMDFAGEGCETWDPEDYEIKDAQPFLEIDDQLCASGQPHMLDILVRDGLLDWSWQVETFMDLTLLKRR